MGRLEGNDHRAGIEAKDLGETAAGDPPVGLRPNHLLPQFEQQGPGAIDLDFRDEAAGQPGGLADQHVGLVLGIQGGGQVAPRLLHVEVSQRHGQQGVVPRGLKVPLPRGQDAAGGQGLENGVGHGEVQRRAPARPKGVLVVQDHRAVGRLVGAVVLIVAGADAEARHPKDLGASSWAAASRTLASAEAITSGRALDRHSAVARLMGSG